MMSLRLTMYVEEDANTATEKNVLLNVYKPSSAI